MLASSTHSVFTPSWRKYGSITAPAQKTDEVKQNEVIPTIVDTKEKVLRIFNIALMALVISGFGMCASLFAPFFPTEAARRGVSATLVGLIFSSFTIVMFIGSLLSGIMVKVLGLHFMIGSGTLLAGGTTILFGLLDLAPPGDSYVALCFIVRTVEGIGGSLYLTAAFALVGEVYPNHIAASYAILEAANGVGRMVGPSLGGVLFSVGGFGLPFYVVGGMLLFFGFVSQVALRWSMPSSTSNSDKDADGKKTQDLPWSHFYRVSADIWILTIVLSVASILVGFPQPTIALYFQQLGLNDEITVGLIFLLGAVCYMLSAVVIGKLADSYPKRVYQMMIIGGLGNAAAMLICGPAPFMTGIIAPSVYLTSAGFCFGGFTIALLMNPSPQAIIDAAHVAGYKDGLNTSAMVSGLYNGMWFLGSFAGAPIAGFLMDTVGFQWGSFIMAVTAFCMTLLLIFRELLHTTGTINKGKQGNDYEQLIDDDDKGNVHESLI